MFGQWLINISNHLACITVDDPFPIPAVFAIDLAIEMVPLAGRAMKVVARHGFKYRLRLSGTFQFESEFLAQPDRIVDLHIHRAGQRAT